MSKEETIQAIREHNRSVSSDYLVSFKIGDLETYLRRLREIKGKRGPQTRWVRPADHTAAMTRLA